MDRLFATQILPLLQTKCFACHGDDPADLKGELDIRSRAGMLKGGESGNAALIPGSPARSPLYLAIRWDDLEMPPKENDRLDARQVELVRRWIVGGAPWPEAERLRELQRAKPLSIDNEKVRVATSGGLTGDWSNREYDPTDLWAYQPLRKPAVPRQFAGESSNPIDAFVNRRLAAAGIEAAGTAGTATLIRRASFDLTGLPPLPSALATYPDDTPAKWSELVDQLLASPRYGEHWARHWLDIVRYADSAGFANDHSRPNAWRYRDYVIRSFNDDKPYNQFIVEQLAGDELPTDNPELLIAVGLLRMGPWEHTSMSVAAVTRQQFLDDVVNNVGVAFLGQELRCCKCHDHKFDPLPTRDYYRMQAIFAPVQFADRHVEFLDSENTSGFAEGQARIKRLIEIKGVRSLRSLARSEWPVEDFDEDTETKGHEKVNHKRANYLRREIKRFEPFAFSVYSGPLRVVNSNNAKHEMPAASRMKGAVQAVHLLKGGSLETPGPQISPGVLSVAYSSLAFDDPAEPASVTTAMHGRRLELANWIAAPDNPLTVRVLVNRVWQYHFGKGLAGNPNNFGKTGKKPTHPDLLDFLASWFIENDWSIKSLHRLIMTSDTYRRAGRPVSSTDTPSNNNDLRVREIDPENALLSWFLPRRLAAEELRDAMLQVTGELNLDMGGIPVRPEINLEVAMQPRHIMGSVAPAYQPSRTPQQRHRRTIYAERIRTLRDPMLEVFNQPGLDTSCERRDTATTTPQTFTLFNGQFAHDRALALAQRIQSETETPEEQIGLAFCLVYGREATPAEITRCMQHLNRMNGHHQKHKPQRIEPPNYVIREMVEEMTGLNFYWVEDLDIYTAMIPDLKPWDVEPEVRALADVCLVLFNSNEFIYVY